MPIKKTLPTKTPVQVWTSDLEREAEKQLERLASLPILFHHVAVMPDVHAGRGSTIGTVIATENAIIPAAVGVDIGCGMAALKTNLPIQKIDEKKSLLRKKIEDSIPLGFNQNTLIHKHIRDLELWDAWDNLHAQVSDNPSLHKKALAQCGTLGGGNHFIEVCRDPEGVTWILLHSGSRHIGKVLADVHIQEARKSTTAKQISLPDRDLAYLTQGSPAFDSYLHDLQWAQNYAQKNREEMMSRVLDIFHEMFGQDFTSEQKIHCHHNYTNQEEHFGKKVWITRKGAVSARKGEWGIIPGSMGAKSYIVKGLGQPESFCSCAHGAGRRMSRTQAKRLFSQEDLKNQTKGIECRKDQGVIDEIPAAYKDIDDVMKNQDDLVEVMTELNQRLCVKG